MKISRLVLAGTSSGVGKTSIVSAIIYGIKKRGYTVQPFKVGPDYIDPSYLSAISGNNARNLDPWLMGKYELMKSFVINSKSNISVIEGVMGYYDGFSGESNFASTHHVATILKSPTILVLDASKTARSIAATALGYVKFHKNSRVVGFILNKLGSKKHENLCRQSLESLKIPILGSVPKNFDLQMSSRHLGLIPVSEQKNLKLKIKKIGKTISNYLDIEKIIRISKNISSLPNVSHPKIKKSQIIIAVALDNSFNFYYQDNLDALRREGAKIKFFSPISDSIIPSCDGLYIGGGFPEILGSSLAEKINGGIVVIGNAPTALLEIIKMIKEKIISPALVIGIPVGFVSSPESKDELSSIDVPFITNIGRKGGSPCASAIVNALFKILREKSSS